MVREHFSNNISKETRAHFPSQLNDFKYFYSIRIIPFPFPHLFAHS